MDKIWEKILNLNVHVGEETDEQKMDKLIEELRSNNPGSSFDQLLILLVKELMKEPDLYTTEQKLHAVVELILKEETKILRFYRIAEFFEHNTKHMIEILQKISGKSEITEFRFLKEDSIRGEEEFRDWNDRLLDEELKRDFEQVQVELMNMSKLNVIKIDVFSFNLLILEDLCEKLPCLKTVEVVINHEIRTFHDNHFKKVQNDMRRLEVLKFNANIRNLEQDNIPYFEKTLDEFFIRSLPGAKIIGEPGRFIDLELLVGEMAETDKSNLRRIAHKIFGDATLPFGNHFPHLDELEINWSEPGSDTFELDGFLLYPFPKLTQLTLTNCPCVEKLRRFMNVYKQLSALTVSFCTSTELCMKHFQGLNTTLRKLVVGVIKPLAGADSIWSLENFESLTELEIGFTVNRDYRGSICVVPICSLLSAPKLEKVRLFGRLAVDLEHLRELHDQITSEDILQKVTHFDMQLIKDGGSKSDVRLKGMKIKKKEKVCRRITKFYKSKGLIVSIGFVPRS